MWHETPLLVTTIEKYTLFHRNKINFQTHRFRGAVTSFETFKNSGMTLKYEALIEFRPNWIWNGLFFVYILYCWKRKYFYEGDSGLLLFAYD